MSQILDARGNPFTGSLDIIGGETITDARTASGTLAAANAELVMDINGKAVASYDLRAAANVTATFVFEATLDGTNYYTVPAWIESTETQTAAVVLSAATIALKYNISASGWRRVRVRCSAYTSGTVTATGRATQSDFKIYTSLVPTTLHVTATASANTAATATLPAAGAGLFHYITNITLVRNATATLAGTATLIHTSTNLPGTPAWSVGNAMAAGGTQIDLSYTPTTPLKSSVANTNTTVVMAAGGAAVLNRVNVSYYIGA